MQQPDRLSRRQRARAIVAARLERLEDLSVGKLVPSSLTLLALSAGATAIRFALESEWRAAVIAVVCAMILDMLDGRAARLFQRPAKRVKTSATTRPQGDQQDGQREAKAGDSQ